MAVTTTKTNKPINPRGNDQSPKGYNRAALYSGKALDFDGVNDQITFGTISDLTFGTGDFSAVLDWQIDSVSTYSWAIAKNPATDLGIGINNTGGLLRLWIGGTLSLGTENILGSDWKKIAVVRESGVVSAYINGVAIPLTETAMAGSIDSGELIVGSWVSNADFWNGLLNNIRIFNTALTAAQVADLYNNPEKIVPTGVADSALKLWLPMMEGAGTTAYDGSSTENGPNLIVNGDFATDSDWTKGTGWTIANGVASHDSSLGPGDLYQDFALTIGKSYKITIEITATDTTELYFMTDGGDYVEVTGSPIGVHSHVFVADESSHRVGVRGSGNWDGSVDNITLEELNFANHGTISGATYVNGVGAPVSQTAVIDWNKGTNLLVYSEQFDDSNWAKANVTITANATTAPDGQSTADEVNASSSFEISDQFVNVASATHIASFWFKNGTINQIFLEIIGGTPDILGQATINLATGTLSDQVGSFTPTIEAYADGWYRVAVGDLGNASVASPSVKIKQSGGNTGTFYVWGAQVEVADSLGAYIPNHTGTPITSPVLLPQGLTSGRDITGVNLFENVRKQGALNLDGNSWAEVHDNASLDFGSGSFTLEAWARVKYVNTGSAYNTIMILGGNASTTGNANITMISSLTIAGIYNNLASGSSTLIEGDWIHIVFSYDQTNATLYINGVQVDQDARTAVDITNDLVKYIGRDSTTTRNYPDQIAQPRIYNRALTASEVLRNYNSGKSTYQ